MRGAGSGGALMSSPDQLKQIMAALLGYRRLPYAGNGIPGPYVEAVLAQVRNGEVLPTYDFADVINREDGVGWTIKSAMGTSPLTWKRAKIPNAEGLIKDSRSGNAGLQALGDAIIGFCNQHARESMSRYNLQAIGYSRVCLTSGEIVYFERELISAANDVLFNPSEFKWHWSSPKKTVKKEQLQALHGVHDSGKKWFACHLLGENQLHFSGEKAWWPDAGSSNLISEPLPDKALRISFDDFFKFLTEQEHTLERIDDESVDEGDAI